MGLTWLRNPPPKDRFCCAHAGGDAYLSPPCEGGAGGGRRASASSVYSPFARKDFRKRHALQTGEAAYAPSTSSIGRAKHALLVHSKLTGPTPLAALHKGKGRGALADLRNEFGRNPRVMQFQLCTTPRSTGGSLLVKRIAGNVTSLFAVVHGHPGAGINRSAGILAVLVDGVEQDVSRRGGRRDAAVWGRECSASRFVLQTSMIASLGCRPALIPSTIRCSRD